MVLLLRLFTKGKFLAFLISTGVSLFMDLVVEMFEVDRIVQIFTYDECSKVLTVIMWLAYT